MAEHLEKIVELSVKQQKSEEISVTTTAKEINFKNSEIRYGSRLKNICLEEDFYALTWISLKDSIWQNKKIRGVDIHLNAGDYFWLHMNFISFLVLLLITIILILYEVTADKGYVASNWAIVILRITLVSFAQKALAPEFYQGLFLLRYSLRYPNEFNHDQFAIFIGACQLGVSCVTFMAIIVFVCMEEEALNLVVEFAGLTVITKLDNWLGEVVMVSKTYEGDENDEEKNEDYKLRRINQKMSLYQKMALIEEEDLVLLDDQNHLEGVHWVVKLIEWIIDVLPWQYCLPFITVFFNYLLPWLRPEEEKVEGEEKHHAE